MFLEQCRNVATKVVGGTGVGYRDTFVNLCRHINETASSLGDARSKLIAAMRGRKEMLRCRSIREATPSWSNTYHTLFIRRLLQPDMMGFVCE
jgi:hypothetical protein